MASRSKASISGRSIRPCYRLVGSRDGPYSGGMGDPSSEKKPHSAEYFGEWRDYWWEPEYVALVLRAWGIEKYKRVLDVGCGVGHWGRVLLPHLPADAM